MSFSFTKAPPFISITLYHILVLSSSPKIAFLFFADFSEVSIKKRLLYANRH
nr:MAG TPA: hypothetical protein [Caudoviricetes sp.]